MAAFILDHQSWVVDLPRGLDDFTILMEVMIRSEQRESLPENLDRNLLKNVTKYQQVDKQETKIKRAVASERLTD